MADMLIWAARCEGPLVSLTPACPAPFSSKKKHPQRPWWDNYQSSQEGEEYRTIHTTHHRLQDWASSKEREKKMIWFPTTTTLLCGALAVLATGQSHRASALSTGATLYYNTTGYIDDLFDTSMSYLDQIYDPTAGYLWYTYYPFAAGKHETRSTVWYAAGLLRRNEGSDVDEAVKILTNVIGDQKKNASDQWFGDYTKYPEEPTVGAAWYPENVSRSLLKSPPSRSTLFMMYFIHRHGAEKSKRKREEEEKAGQ